MHGVAQVQFHKWDLHNNTIRTLQYFLASHYISSLVKVLFLPRRKVMFISDNYLEEYNTNLVEQWDTLID